MRGSRSAAASSARRSARSFATYGDYAGSAVRLPEYYDNKFIHYDWMRGWMLATTLSPSGDYVRMEPFLSQLTFDHPVDVEMGSDGSLYVLEYGTYWNAKNANARLSRITYHPGNRPPVAKLVASRTVGAAPLTVELSADSSFDRDPNDSIHFTWTIPGLGERPTLGKCFIDRPLANRYWTTQAPASLRDLLSLRFHFANPRTGQVDLDPQGFKPMRGSADERRQQAWGGGRRRIGWRGLVTGHRKSRFLR